MLVLRNGLLLVCQSALFDGDVMLLLRDDLVFAGDDLVLGGDVTVLLCDCAGDGLLALGNDPLLLSDGSLLADDDPVLLRNGFFFVSQNSLLLKKSPALLSDDCALLGKSILLTAQGGVLYFNGRFKPCVSESERKEAVEGEGKGGEENGEEDKER